MDLLQLRALAMAFLKTPLVALGLSPVCEGTVGLSWSLFLLSLSQGFRQMKAMQRRQDPASDRSDPSHRLNDHAEERGSSEGSVDTLRLSATTDTVLGMLLASGVLFHVATLGWCIDRAGARSVDVPERASWYQDVVTSAVAFLTSEPIGMKLNDELAGFLGTSSKTVFDAWTALLSRANPWLSQAVVVSLGLTGAIFGASYCLSLFADFLLIATTPLFLTTLPIQGLFRLQLATIVAFGRLSMGVKWNPLQERVDSVTSSPGQLVLSALLFTSAFLLVPTTALFFLFLLLPCLAVALTRHTLFLTSRFLSSIPLHYLLSSGATPSASSQVTVSHSLACCTRTSSSRASSPSQASVMPLADLGGLVGPLLSGQRFPLFQTRDPECKSAPT